MGSRFKVGVGTDRRGVREEAVIWVYSSGGGGGTRLHPPGGPHPHWAPIPQGLLMSELSYLLRVLLQDGQVLLQLVQPPVGIFAGRCDYMGKTGIISPSTCAPLGAWKAGRCWFAGTGPGAGQNPSPHPRNSQEVGPGLSGASLTLWFQLGEDGLGPADSGRSEGLHALLGRVADGLDMGVALLGGGVGCRHHVAGGADEGHAGHTVHHARLWGQAAQRAGPGPRVPCNVDFTPGQATAQPMLALHPSGCTSPMAPPLP